MNFLLNPVLTGKLSVIARGVMVILVLTTLIILHQLDATYNYYKGYKKSVSDHPQNVYNGPTTVNQGRRMGCFPLHIGHYGFGVCHD